GPRTTRAAGREGGGGALPDHRAGRRAGRTRPTAMNPFDLYGPQYLLFYAVLSIVVLAVAAYARRMTEAASEGAARHAAGVGFADPYAIAYLRGGASEAIRVAIVSLVDRGLLAADDTVHTTALGTQTKVRKPLEQALLEKCLVA